MKGYEAAGEVFARQEEVAEVGAREVAAGVTAATFVERALVVPIRRLADVGAAFGDWVSYWVGLKLEYTVAHIWPLSRHPELIPRGEAFMKKWGVVGIFIGRFFGPLRASVPLIAGIFEMPFWQFQIANFISAFIWAATLLTIGDVISKVIVWLW